MRTGRARTRGSSRWATSSRRIAPRTAIAPRTRSCGLGIALTGLRERRELAAPRATAWTSTTPRAWRELALAAAGAPGAETTRWAAGTGPRYLEAGRAAGLAVDGRAVGWFGEVARGVREAFDLPAPVFVAELSLTALGALPQAVPRYQPLPRFPAVQRDLAIVVPASVLAGDVEARLRAMQGIGRSSRAILLFDVYEGDQVGAGRRSLAFSLTYQAPDRTLTDGKSTTCTPRSSRRSARASGPRSGAHDGGESLGAAGAPGASR